MHCSRAAQLLQLYVDKRLSLDRMHILEVHLSECDACRRELVVLETIEQALRDFETVAEPPDLTANIMRRVALSARQREEAPEVAKRDPSFVLFRPSLMELLAVVGLATFAMLGIVLGEPSLRAILPLVNGHGWFSLFFVGIWNFLLSINSNTLMLALYLLGTALGVWITLLVAGNEMRRQWFKAMTDRLPVW